MLTYVYHFTISAYNRIHQISSELFSVASKWPKIFFKLVARLTLGKHKLSHTKVYMLHAHPPPQHFTPLLSALLCKGYTS